LSGEYSVTETSTGHGFTEKRKENLITAIYFGSILIILAAVYAINLPFFNIWDKLVDFFLSLTLSPVAGGISLPAPSNPAVHMDLYMAGFQFAIGLGIAEIVILALRIMLHSPIARKAETIENIVFWLGAGFLIITYLVNMTIITEWFVFWAGIILIFGLALVSRSIILLVGCHS
jgi:hypothetical protein